jgi:tRNA uridine 5-carbamoylmethylation protein Kti12
MKKILLSTTCGLPGCGKTTFISCLKQCLQSTQQQQCKMILFSINMDQLYLRFFKNYDSTNNSSIVDQNNNYFNPLNWKKTRLFCLNQVLKLVQLLKRLFIEPNQLSLSTTINQFNIEFENDENIDVSIDDNNVSLSKTFSFDNSQLKDSDDSEKQFLIIIDDNMYYKSMRKEYFNISRQCKLKNCVLLP